MRNAVEIPFRFEMPLDTWSKASEPGKQRRIGGIISTESKDRQGEIVLQRGLDFSEFVANGWFNDNHSKDTAGILGYPIKVEKVTHNGRPAHKVEGYLLDGYEPADRIWKLAQSLQATGRRLGFSIEGSVRQRAGGNDDVVAEAIVRNVAITNCPVNTDTQLEIVVKSMMALEAAARAPKRSEVQKALEVLERALMAGSSISGSGMPGDGFALRTESVERKCVTPKKRKRTLTKSEALTFVRTRFPGLTMADAERVLRFANA